MWIIDRNYYLDIRKYQTKKRVKILEILQCVCLSSLWLGCYVGQQNFLFHLS